MQTNCICAPILIALRVYIAVYAKCIYVLAGYLKYKAYEGIAIFLSLRGLSLPGRLSSMPVSRNF